MYDFVYDISVRPAPFSSYTAKDLWTRPHLSRQMLEYHLSQDSDLASRRFDVIDNVVKWIDKQLGFATKKVCDLGCGPGLYTQRFNARGAKTTGIDFSKFTLDYAKSTTSQAIDYIQADYLEDELPTGFDIITLIYTDLCVLSPQQRATLLGKMRKMLNPDGRIVLDVAGMALLNARQARTVGEKAAQSDSQWQESARTRTPA